MTELVEISGKNGEKLDVLTELFHEKIETDTHKNQLFDQMYSQLKKYQDDVLDSLQEPLIKDLLSLLDGIKQFERFMPEEATQENYEKLRKRFGDFREDLEDILEDLDVCRYDTDPVVPDPKRQKIVKTIVTEDADKNNTVEKKISDGYLYRNRILKYEKISIYKYNEKTEEV